MKKRTKPTAQRSPGLISRKKAARAAAPRVRSGPMRVDPTRTLTLRKAFARALKKAFGKIKTKLYKLIVLDDAFGLKPPAHDPFTADKVRWADPGKTIPTANTRWAFTSDADKLSQFTDWLRTQLEEDVLGDLTDPEDLWRKFIEQGFAKGAGRAFDDTKAAARGAMKGQELAPDQLHQQALVPPLGLSSYYSGRRDEFLRAAFGQPVARETLELLVSRTFSDLEGVTDAMGSAMTRTLADGLVRGASPEEVARDLMGNVDGIGIARANTIARTEIIRAHAEGQLVAMEQLGVEEVGVAVEWNTAGDDKVCAECEPLQGIVMKLAEAKGMLPRHPNCRCAWIPANVGEDEGDSKRTQEAIEAALGESAGADGEGGYAPEAKAGGSWGSGVPIAAGRPRSILNEAQGEEDMVEPSLLDLLVGMERARAAVDNNSFFETCERDGKGRCLPGDGGLEVTAGSVTLYHGTASSALASIMKDGIVARGGKGADDQAKAAGKGDFTATYADIAGRPVSVFATNSPEMASTYGYRASQVNKGSHTMVLRVEIPAGTVIKEDEVGGSKAFRIEGAIKPEWIKEHFTVDYDKDELVSLGSPHKVTHNTTAKTYYLCIQIHGKPLPTSNTWSPLIVHGGPGSGNFGHGGRSGEVGGSAGGQTGGGVKPKLVLPLGKAGADRARTARDKRADTPIPDHIKLPETLYVSMPRHAAEATLRGEHAVGTKGALGHSENRTDSVYLATAKEITDHYAGMYADSKVLAVRTADLDRSKMYYDAFEPPLVQGHTRFDDSHPGYVAYRGALPGHAVKLVGNRWTPFIVHGGPSSGNFGHGGRPGELGGSSAEGGAGPAFGPHAKVHEGLARYPHGVAVTKLAGELKLSQKATRAGLDALVSGGHADDLGGGLYGPKRTFIPVVSPAPSAPARATATPGTIRAGAPGGSAARGPATPLSGAAHAPAVARAYLSLRERDRGGYGLVDIADLAKETGKSVHETLAGVNHLRQTGALSASKYEGRGTLKPHQLAVREAQGDTFDSVGLVSAKDESHLHRLAANAWSEPQSGIIRPVLLEELHERNVVDRHQGRQDPGAGADPARLQGLRRACPRGR